MYRREGKEPVHADIKTMEEVVDMLNAKFDPFDIFHHSSSPNEMFEFKLHIASFRTEAWEITCMGKTVAAGDGFGLDYGGCYEEDYLELVPENKDKIYQMAYEGTLHYFETFVNYIAFANIPSSVKDEWKEKIDQGVEHVQKWQRKE